MPDALKIEYRALTTLKLDPNNARVHDKEQIREIAKSIRRFGFVNPILADKHGVLIAGEGRYRAAKRLKMDAVPVIELTHITGRQRVALALADNRIGLNSSWGPGTVLRNALTELDTFGEDIEGLGFSDRELDRLLSSEDVEQDASPQLGDMEYRVVVTCKNEQDQRRMLKRFEKEGLECRALIS